MCQKWTHRVTMISSMFLVLPAKFLFDGKWLGVSLSIPGNEVSVVLAATGWPAVREVSGNHHS
jgi:hypothetical protein